MHQIFREITPLTEYDCYQAYARDKIIFDFPLHYHEEYEINLILNGEGVQRVVGNHQSVIDDTELVLVGPNLPHAWFTNEYDFEKSQKKVHEVTIHFGRYLLDENFMKRNQMHLIKQLLNRSKKGIAFSAETTQKLYPKVYALTHKSSFEGILELLEVLHEMSIAEGIKLLSDDTFSDEKVVYKSRRIEDVYEYMRNNFPQPISLADVAEIAGMTEVSFSRFIKTKTGKTFIDSLNEIRLGHAARMLIETHETISEIARKSGFNNLSYFNRLFKSKKNVTPKKFREDYTGSRNFV
ncbi:AraC family transcriptional regulator [Marinilongibacter aquaticus]|uniref:AraC family transcriptional regulator n=1 Tax=Marinilongibacter aquaticus TaxID=2975157 RepID=UPI0021BD9662|nr:AraC family transcriptional regulator [Marinilongibacter aquaticus]UBM60888.1 AraC family transcriptional regulator [Marinilongibacter aquaticus]